MHESRRALERKSRGPAFVAPKVPGVIFDPTVYQVGPGSVCDGCVKGACAERSAERRRCDRWRGKGKGGFLAGLRNWQKEQPPAEEAEARKRLNAYMQEWLNEAEGNRKESAMLSGTFEAEVQRISPSAVDEQLLPITAIYQCWHEREAIFEAIERVVDAAREKGVKKCDWRGVVVNVRPFCPR